MHVWEGWAAGTRGVTGQGLRRSKLRFETGLMCRGLICASAGSEHRVRIWAVSFGRAASSLGGIALADRCVGSACRPPAASRPHAARAGIKVALPCESVTGTCFLQLYCQFILALQARCGGSVRLPFAIMTSDDTHARTQALLEQHNYFGMEPGQVWKEGWGGVSQI